MSVWSIIISHVRYETLASGWVSVSVCLCRSAPLFLLSPRDNRTGQSLAPPERSRYFWHVLISKLEEITVAMR